MKKESPIQKYWRLDGQEDDLVMKINILRRELHQVRKEKNEVKTKRRSAKNER